MARDDVDFVVGDEAPRAEPTGEPPAGPRRLPRRWLVLGAAVVVLVGGGVTVRNLTDDGAKSRVASSGSPSGTATSVDRDSSTALDPVRGTASPLPTPTARLGCPEFVACSKTAAIPADIVRAVRTVFPTARPVRGQTVLLLRDNTSTAEVHARLVTFAVGQLELVIRVSTPGATADDRPAQLNSRTVIRTAPTGQYLTVEIAARSGVELPGYDVLQRLVADSRLLTT